MNLTIDCLGPCPCNSKDCLEDLEFNLKNINSNFEGTYTLASEMVNERPYWILTDKNLALWYDGNNWITNINHRNKTGSTQGKLSRGIENKTVRR